MSTLREAAQQALEHVQEFKRRWMAVPPFGNKVNKATREAVTLAHTPVFQLEEALRAALEEPEQEPVAISWVLDGDKDCGYNNWLGITPFGRILITWKGWKEHLDACVDEFPGVFQAYGEPDYVKAACEAEYIRRLGRAHPPRREWRGLTEEEIGAITMPDWNCFQNARAIEAALKEKNHE
jgi:hypothetical protein